MGFPGDLVIDAGCKADRTGRRLTIIQLQEGDHAPTAGIRRPAAAGAGAAAKTAIEAGSRRCAIIPEMAPTRRSAGWSSMCRT